MKDLTALGFILISSGWQSSESLIFPSSNNKSPQQNQKALSYQSTPETITTETDYVHAETEFYNDYGYEEIEQEEEEANQGYSILDFLKSKSPGTGYIEVDRQSSYYTLEPTLDMLIDWTLDYVGR
jgi:hypothetical protein